MMRFVLVLVTLCLLAGVSAAAPKPAAKDRCAVCGMFVAKYPAWVASVSTADGRHFFFDGVKDMMTFLLNRSSYDPQPAAPVAAVSVTDYYSLQQTDGKLAWYVAGSDQLGPMGRELIPHKSEADAKEFLHDHKGKQIFRFSEITPAVLRGLQ